jgi:hypothetical protein
MKTHTPKPPRATCRASASVSPAVSAKINAARTAENGPTVTRADVIRIVLTSWASGSTTATAKAAQLSAALELFECDDTYESDAAKALARAVKTFVGLT